MDIITGARKSAIKSDIKLNDSDSFFMVNRKGESRFLTMLTDLENKLLENWATDPHGIRSFHKYNDYFIHNLILEINSLEDSLPNSYKVLKDSLNAIKINNPRSYTMALAQLDYHLSSQNFPGHLRALALPLVNRMRTRLNCYDKVKNTQQIQLAKLFVDINKELDKYAAMGNKSSERVKSFKALKKALNTAMTSKANRYDALKNAIMVARSSAIDSDQDRLNNFFRRSPHSGGESRYLSLLGKLSDLVIESNTQDTKWQSAYRQAEYDAAKAQLYKQLVAFYDSKAESWGETRKTIISNLRESLRPIETILKADEVDSDDSALIVRSTEILNPDEVYNDSFQIVKDDNDDLISPDRKKDDLSSNSDDDLGQEQEEEDKDKLIEQPMLIETHINPKLIEKHINNARDLLPGYLQVLADEVLRTQDELEKQLEKSKKSSLLYESDSGRKQFIKF